MQEGIIRTKLTPRTVNSFTFSRFFMYVFHDIPALLFSEITVLLFSGYSFDKFEVKVSEYLTKRNRISHRIRPNTNCRLRQDMFNLKPNK